jgi:hypothetical protein
MRPEGAQQLGRRRPWTEQRVDAHTLAIDGVYVRDQDSQELRFHALPEPTHEDVTELARRVADRIQRKYGDRLGAQYFAAMSKADRLHFAERIAPPRTPFA